MSKVLTVVAAIFFLGGLALTVGYVAHQIVQWRMHGTINLEHAYLFILGGSGASVGMLTLALLEIRMAILERVDHSESSAGPPAPGTPAASHTPKRSWKKSADIKHIFLDTSDPR